MSERSNPLGYFGFLGLLGLLGLLGNPWAFNDERLYGLHLLHLLFGLFALFGLSTQASQKIVATQPGNRWGYLGVVQKQLRSLAGFAQGTFEKKSEVIIGQALRFPGVVRFSRNSGQYSE